MIITEWGYQFKPRHYKKWQWINNLPPSKEQQVQYYLAFTNLLNKYNFDGSFLWLEHPEGKIKNEFCPGSTHANIILEDYFKE